MLKKTISVTLIIALLVTSINWAGLKVYASGGLTNTSTVIDFDALMAKVESDGDTEDSDNDGVYDKVEKILGTDSNYSDTDRDGLDDYFELTKGLDPLNHDTNNDGVNDLFEITKGEGIDPDVELDSDGDGIANVFDDDNDNDGIVDSIDISPFSFMETSRKQELELITNGDFTFVNIQIRPADVEEIIEYGRSMTWPEDDKGEIQNIEYKKDNVNIRPFLKVKGADTREDVREKYGYILYDDSLYIPIEKLESNGIYVGYQGSIYLPSGAGEKISDDEYKVDLEIELSYLMTIKNDYIGQGIQQSGKILHSQGPIKLEGFDELREKQFLNSSIGDLDGNKVPDLALFYLNEEDVDNGLVSITYDLYPDIEISDGEIFSTGEAILDNVFEINTGFTSVNKEADNYTYMSRYDFDIVDGEIVCFYIDGKDIAKVYKATSNGNITDTGISIANGQREYFKSRSTDDQEKSTFIGSNITDGSGYYKNDTYFYMYAKELDGYPDRDATYLAIKKDGQAQREIPVELNSNMPEYKYSTSEFGPEDGCFADTELSTSLDILDINSDGKDDLVMLSYGYGTGIRTEYSELYFISDIFAADLDKSWEIVTKVNIDIKSGQGYARSMDICDINGDDHIDLVVVNANKEIRDKFRTETRKIGPKDFSIKIPYEEMDLNFEMDLSYSIFSREDIILTHETEFEITGINIESQNEIYHKLLSHEKDELMLGVAQAFEYEFVGTSKEMDQAISYVEENMGLDEANINLGLGALDNFSNTYDDGIVKIGQYLSDQAENYQDTRAFIIAIQKKHRFKNLDEIPLANENGLTSFNIKNTDQITSKEMSLKWVVNGVLASPDDILTMIDGNPDEITYFDEYKDFARNDLSRLNIGTTNITEIGGEKIESINQQYDSDMIDTLYSNTMDVLAGLDNYIYVAQHTFAKEPIMKELVFNYRTTKVTQHKIIDGSKVAKASKYDKYNNVGKLSSALGLGVDIAYSCFNGYMYGQELEARGADDTIVGGAQVVYTALHTGYILISAFCTAAGPIGWVAWGLIMADTLLEELTGGKYGGYITKGINWVVKALYDYKVYEGTYISTFDLEDKEISRSNDGYFTWINDTYNEKTTYQTIISAKDKNSPANSESKLDDCWVQIYDDLESADARTDNNKSWDEEFYIFKDKWRQKRYFDFDNTARFNEVGRNVLIENDVLYKYKIIERVIKEKEHGKEDIKYEYNDKNKIYDLNERDLYFDILPRSFEVFFETYDLVDGIYENSDNYGKNELGCRDIDGDGLFVDENGNEIDDDGKILTSDSDKFDTDNDGLSDYLEASIGSDPRNPDTDGDGLGDFEEFILGTSLTDRDTDGDGVDDYTEVKIPVSFTVLDIPASGYSSPLLADSDGDLLSDLEERNRGSNPASMFTLGGELFDGNNRAPSITVPFDDHYSLTDGAILVINLNNHIGDDNDLVFTSDYGQVDENGVLSYTYDKRQDGTSFEMTILASDSRNGILETKILIRDDVDNPFIEKVMMDGKTSDSIDEINFKVSSDSQIKIVFNEEIKLTSSSSITITPIKNKNLDVDSSGNRLTTSCSAIVLGDTVTITRAGILVENNIKYRIDIHHDDIMDTNNNLLDRDYSIDFEMIDNIAPRIVSVSNQVGIGDPLQVKFNEPIYMKPNHRYSNYGGGIYLRTTDGKSLSGGVAGDTFTANIKSNSLDSNTRYTLANNTNKFWDLEGNVYEGFESMQNSDKRFTTLDVNGPYTTLTESNFQSPFILGNPKYYESNITGGEIRIPFDEDIAEGIDYKSIALSYENNLYFYGANTGGAKDINREAKKYMLPYTSRIERNTLVIVPDNYDSGKNYSIFIKEKSISDLEGNDIRDFSGVKMLRILAKSPGIPTNVGINNAGILGLVCTNSDMSKWNIVSKELNNRTIYSDQIGLVFNQLLVPTNPLGVQPTIKNESNQIVPSSSEMILGIIFSVTPNNPLDKGTYTITIPAGSFMGVGELRYTFVVENEINIEISANDVEGSEKVDQRLYLSNTYLENALKQDKNIDFSWYRSNTNNFINATPIDNSNSPEYILTDGDEDKYIYVSAQNGNVFEVSPAIGPIEGPANEYSDIDNISVEYETESLISYDSNTLTYDITVSAEKDKVDVSAIFDKSQNMEVKINGIKDHIWQEEGSMLIPLFFGENEILVESIAENGVNNKTYTIKITRDKNLGRENLKPIAKEVAITNPNESYLGQIFEGSYEYRDELSRMEGDSTYKWYRVEEEFVLIDSANSNTYALGEDDIGYQIIFSVTPVTEDGVVGDEVFSPYSQLVTREEEGYTVSFDSKGGSPVDPIRDIAKDTSIDLPTDPTRADYSFQGWYTDDVTFENVFTESTPVVANITLYAKWQADSSGGSSGGSATFKKIEVNETEEDKKYNFIDLLEDEWYYGPIMKAINKGWFAGTSETTFSPNLDMSRGMIVTVLWRIEGQPVSNANAFTDIMANKYYTRAVNWAAEKGIVTGYGDNLFGPNDSISREQMASILYRYAQYKEYDTKLDGMKLREFLDFEEISEYALAPLTWTVNKELIQGANNKLMPKDSATRAQVATILVRFSETLVKYPVANGMILFPPTAPSLVEIEGIIMVKFELLTSKKRLN